MPHDFDRRPGAIDGSRQEVDAQPVNQTHNLALQKKLHERRIADHVRSELKGQVAKAAEATQIGINLFQAMMRGDDEKSLQKQVDPDLAGMVKDKVVDHVISKIKSGLSTVTGIGSELAKNVSTVFGTVKGVIDKKIKVSQKLTVLQLGDVVFQSLEDAALQLKGELTAAIAGLSQQQLLGIGRALDAAEKAAASDPDDSAERGDLKEGMREWAMTSLIGLPAGDLVASGEVAKAAYDEFQAAVRSSGTAAEETDAIQHRLKNPYETNDKLEAAQEKMGPEFKKSLERDKTLRGRVQSAGQ